MWMETYSQLKSLQQKHPLFRHIINPFYENKLKNKLGGVLKGEM